MWGDVVKIKFNEHVSYFYASITGGTKWWHQVDREVVKNKHGFYWRKVRNGISSGTTVGPFDSEQDAINNARGGTPQQLIDSRMIG